MFDLIGRIEAPGKIKTSRMSSGVHTHSSPVDDEGVSHTMVWVPIGCSCVLGVDRAR